MKRTIFAALFVLSGVPFLHADTVGIELDAGILKNTAGSAPVPLTGLLQIVANPTSTSATFSPLSAGSFTSGSDILLVNLAMNYNGNPTVQGETDNLFSITVNSIASSNSPTSLDVGEPILLRWFPQFEYVGGAIIRNPNVAIGGVGPNTLQAGDVYGSFRSATGENMGISWSAPTGGNYALVFNTILAGGAHPETDGYAVNIVLPAVPEPSTCAVFGLGLGGLAFFAMQRRRQMAFAV